MYTYAVAMRMVKKYLPKKLEEFGISSANSLEEKEAFLENVTPYLISISEIEKDKEALKRLKSLGRENTIDFLNGYVAPKIDNKSSGKKKRSPLAETKRESEEAIKEAKRSYELLKKQNKFIAVKDAEVDKYSKAGEYTLTVYKETEKIVSERERKHLDARISLAEYTKQLKLREDESKQYKKVGRDVPSEVSEDIKTLIENIELAKDELVIYAPLHKRFTRRVVGKIKMLFGGMPELSERQEVLLNV